MHRKRKFLLAIITLIILILLYLKQRDNSNKSINTFSKRFEGLNVNQPTECKHEIVWLVHSKLTNFESRRTIRESFSIQELDKLGVMRIFVLGVDASYEYLSVESRKVLRDAHDSNDNDNMDGNYTNESISVNGDGNLKNNSDSNNINDSISNFDTATYYDRNVINSDSLKLRKKNRRNINNSTPSTQFLITKEQEKFGDLLQIDFLDTYRNLTLKHVTGLNYTITHCPNVFYVLKSDDDIIIDIPRVLRIIKKTLDNSNSNNDYVHFIGNSESNIDSNTDNNLNNNYDFTTNQSTVKSDTIKPSSKSEPILISALLNKQSPLNIFGFVQRNKLVERNPGNKWFVSVEEYNENYFPTFASGWFYFTTKPAVQLLLESYVNYTSNNKEFWIDDVFLTGVLRVGTGVGVVDLNEMYAVDYRYLECCIKDISRNLHCDYAVGPDGGKKNLHKEFNKFLEFCRHSCMHRTKENSVRNTCIVAYTRDEDIGKGKAVIESLKR